MKFQQPLTARKNFLKKYHETISLKDTWGLNGNTIRNYAIGLMAGGHRLMTHF